MSAEGETCRVQMHTRLQVFCRPAPKVPVFMPKNKSESAGSVKVAMPPPPAEEEEECTT